MAKPIRLQELSTVGGSEQALLNDNFQIIKDLRVKLSVVVGRCQMTVGEMFSLKDESVVKLEQLTNEPVEILLDGKIVARGDLVVVDNNFGVRITEISRAS